MLLTKKTGTTQAAARSPFVHSLQRGLSTALPTMDRRLFLRRSGLGVTRFFCQQHETLPTMRVRRGWFCSTA